MEKTKYVNGRKGKFTIWTWEAQDSISDPLAFVVYLTLKRFADFNTGENCYVSDSKAAQTAKVSVRTFIDRREMLKQLGWITWESGKENGTTNLYKINETMEGSAPNAEGYAGGAEGSAPDADLGMRHVQTTNTSNTKRHNQETTTNNIGEQIKEVFEYWQKVMNYPDRKLIDSRKAPINARLSDGFSVEQLKAVIDVASKDPFWRGKNDRKTPYDDIDNIFRNTARVDKFLSQVNKKQQLTWISTQEERERNKGKWIKD